MPFVTEEHRQKPDLSIAGDRCYIRYKAMMEKWTENPRWSTIDKLAEELFPDEWKRAEFLAFLVFFCFNGLPYEDARKLENGDI